MIRTSEVDKFVSIHITEEQFMTTKDRFLQIMRIHTEMALATSTYNQPNIRIVNFYYDENEKVIYFLGFEDKDKTREFEINPKIAFTTIPPQRNGMEHVKAKGFVRKSHKTIFNVMDRFIEKIPSYKRWIDEAASDMVLFEISFETAVITLDFENVAILNIEDL